MAKDLDTTTWFINILETIHGLNSRMPEERSVPIIALKAGEELGELNEAILVKNGFKKHKELEDGVVGEAVDLALCALSIALKEGDIDDVKGIIQKKMKKWEDSVCNL